MILGATGLVGSQLLKQALVDTHFSHVVAPTRRSLLAHPKLNNPIVDFQHLPIGASWWGVDAVVCALGTTMKQAGSRAAFYMVDHDYVLNAAKLAQAAGSRCCVLNSSVGANTKSNSYYLRVKGEIERDIEALGFDSLTLVRPSLLKGEGRPDKRFGESIAIGLSTLLGPLVPPQYRPVEAKLVSAVMLESALAARRGKFCIESNQILGIGHCK
jgi:uncharacterized protein YbjT (DUF2867 family)